MAIENKLPQQDLDVDEILYSGKPFDITSENAHCFYKGMEKAKERTSCRSCVLDDVGTVNIIDKDGNLKEREVVLGGKKCEAGYDVIWDETCDPPKIANIIETTTVTVFKYIGPSREEFVTSKKIDRPMWTCPEFIKKTYPAIIKKAKME